MAKKAFNSEKRPKKIKVAAIQMNTQSDPVAARAQATKLIREAAAHGAKFIVTPEYTNVLNDKDTDSLAVIQPDDETNEDLNHFKALAKELGIWLDLGSMAIKQGDKILNRQFLISPEGNIVARYDKIHLFDVDLPDGKVFREGDTIIAGDHGTVAEVPFGKVGMNICYDIRFPELQKAEMIEGGATILTVPSAYSMASGRRTWETFLRARAAETGCYIIAPAQCGKHNNGGGQCWGHSMIVDPWGKVIAQAEHPNKPGIVYATLDPKKVEASRKAYAVERQSLKARFNVQSVDAAGNVVQTSEPTPRFTPRAALD